MKKNSLYFLSSLLVLSVFFCMFSLVVPFHPEEFSQYTAFCYNPHAEIPDDYARTVPLKVWPGIVLPLRSDLYIGSLGCLFYYPLYNIWPSPYSARLVGLLFLCLQAFCLAKLFRTRFLLCVLGLLSIMPYAFLHLADTGPVSFQLSAIMVIWLILDRWRSAPSIWHALAIGLLLALCVWHKLVFVSILPAMACCVYGFVMIAKREYRKKLLAQSVVIWTAMLVPLSWLFSGKTDWQQAYWHVLQKGNLVTDYQSILNHVREHIGFYFSNPISVVHKIFYFERQATLLGLFFWGSVLILLAYGMYRFRKERQAGEYAHVFIALVSAAAVLAGLSLSSAVWAMHHVILVFPFIIIACGYILKQRQDPLICALLVLFIGTNSILYATLPFLTPKVEASREIVELNSVINERYTDGYIVVVIDYVAQHVKKVFGTEEQVVYYLHCPPPWDQSFRNYDIDPELTTLADIQKKTGKRLVIFISNRLLRTKYRLLAKHFPAIRQAPENARTQEWKLFLVD